MNNRHPPHATTPGNEAAQRFERRAGQDSRGAACLPKRHAFWLLIACALTTAIFPWQFVALLEQRHLAVLLLNMRNALLFGGSVWLLRDLVPLSAPAAARTAMSTPTR